MEIVLALVGGIIYALLVHWFAKPTPVRDPFDSAPATDVINMARIRVAGVGGLGLVAMAAVVAFAVPRIGQTLALGLVLGGVLAGSLILLRRRSGGMSSPDAGPHIR